MVTRKVKSFKEDINSSELNSVVSEAKSHTRYISKISDVHVDSSHLTVVS